MFALGSANFGQEKYQAAVENILAGLAIKPNDPEALFDLGNSYYKLNRLPEAISQYDKAVAGNQKFWPAINNIGLIKYEQGDIAGAIASWQNALKIDKQAAEPQLAIAAALYAQGKQQQGVAAGEAALK